MTSLGDASAASAVEWRTQGKVDLSELANARVETINIVQWPARIANSYVSDPDPTRTNLEFLPAESVFLTRRFENGLALGMSLPKLEMQFREHGKPVPHVFDPEEHSPAETEAWLLVELLHRGIDREKFSKALPYTIPGLMSGDAEDYSPQACEAGLRQLTALFQDAAAVLDAATRAAGGAAQAMLCSPRTLDLWCGPDKSSHFGFSPGGAQNAEPHFFVQNGTDDGARRLLAIAIGLIAEKSPVVAAAKLRQLAAS